MTKIKDGEQRAITIRQPYAGLLVAGIKQIETRPQRTHFRGRLFIHAGKSLDEQHLKDAFTMDEFAKHFFTMVGMHESINLPDNAFRTTLGLQKALQLQRSAIIGSVDVVDCIDGYEWIKSQRGRAESAYDREWALGDLSGNRFAWVTENPIAFKTPILCNGSQGFWNCTKYVLDL